MYNNRTPFLAVWPAVALLALTGCGGSGSENDTDFTPSTGVFIDSPVANIRYRTQTQSGVTNTDGEFLYFPGESVTFSIGDIDFPTTLARPVVTPLDLAGSGNTISLSALNISQLLISLDSDPDLDNGILISDLANSAATGLSLDFNAPDFETAIANLVSNSGAYFGIARSQADTLQHLETSLGVVATDQDGDGLLDFEDPFPADPTNDPFDPSVTLCDRQGLSHNTLSTGTATIQISDDWQIMGQTLNNFIGAEGNTLLVGLVSQPDTLLGKPAPIDFDLKQTFSLPVNPPDNVYADAGELGGPARRKAIPTNFGYLIAPDRSLVVVDPTPGIVDDNEISLAGVLRFTVAPELGGGQLIYGDFGLRFNETSSTWELVNNIDFRSVVFTLENVQVTVRSVNEFTLSGDMIGAPLLALLLDAAVPAFGLNQGAFGRDFGDFTFTGTCE